MAGSVQTLTITTTSGHTLHLIFKQILPDAPSWIVPAKIYRIEHAIYRTVLPALKDFSKAKGVSYSPPTPLYISGFNNDANDYLVLEDVREVGYRMEDKRLSLTLPQMEAVLKEFAKFHAISYAFLRHEGERIFEKGEDFGYLVHDSFEDGSDNDGPDMFDTLIQVYFEAAAEVMGKRLPQLKERIEKIVPNAWRIRKLANSDGRYFPTIMHNDLWVNNILFKYDQDQISVKFIDFQFAHKGNIFNDLQYLFFTSTTASFRKAHLKGLLDTYYAAFTSELEDLGTPLPLGFSRGFLLDEFLGVWQLVGVVHMGFAITLQLGHVGAVVKDAVDQNEDEAMGDPLAIRQMIERSPNALQRFEELFLEAAELNVI